MSRAASQLRSDSYRNPRGSAGRFAPAGGHGAGEPLSPGVDAKHKPGESHLRLIEMGRRTRYRPTPRAALAVTIVAATVVCLALVYVHVVLAQRQFAIDNTNAQISKQETVYQNLRLKVAELSSPANIISTAEGKLGMVQPSSVKYLTPTPADQPVGVATKGSVPPSSGVLPSVTMTPSSDSNWPMVKSLMAGLP